MDRTDLSPTECTFVPFDFMFLLGCVWWEATPAFSWPFLGGAVLIMGRSALPGACKTLPREFVRRFASRKKEAGVAA